MDHTASSPSTTDRLPVLFVSHGSPMFALEAGETGPALTRWGQALRQRHPGLRGVVILSPHWMAHGVEVMAHAQPPTWHDFGGFPPALYRLQYPAPGAPVLAQQVQARLAQAGIAATLNPERPLDHGAWVPLMHLLPQADVPVVQLALPVDADARAVYALGQALQDLRAQGVLLVGSGSMTHNLREFFGGERQAASYVVEFSRWVEQQVQAGAIDALLDWQQQAPHALRAHPTDEHFLPLYFALGAGAGSTPHYLSREVMYGMLAMDAFALQDE
ncbi:class III extradiol ring-cleavage dioxygenase [Comamonas aquatica]|uniref:DODA-type extradiol aromatic ring-opening family dioxygenase n=1 Tax=Comamonas aquatica TaxID=225991 RepID=UPI0028D77B1A|nr:class III extradiol ring-cleavage dioxygenase [Comamonas aquatica]